MFLGYLLPVVKGVIVKLTRLSAPTMGSLVLHLIKRIKERFEPVLNGDMYKLAAAFHPENRLKWAIDDQGTPDHDEKDRIRGLMVREVETLAPGASEQGGHETQSVDLGDDDFFDDVYGSSSGQSQRNSEVEFNAEQCVINYLNSHQPRQKAFTDYPILIRAFIKFNTPLPSSAPSERLFSLGKEVLRARRASMTDENFNQTMFLRANEGLDLT